MSDMREKQPAKRKLDLTNLGTGDHFVAVIETWTYSSIKNEDVFSREVTVQFRAPDFSAAVGFAQSLATVIGIAHDVWQCNVRLVAEARFHDTTEAKADKIASLPDDVRRLIIAAREVAFGDVANIVRSCHAASGEAEGEAVDAIRELDQASEAFADRVHLEDQPDEDEEGEGE